MDIQNIGEKESVLRDNSGADVRVIIRKSIAVLTAILLAAVFILQAVQIHEIKMQNDTLQQTVSTLQEQVNSNSASVGTLVGDVSPVLYLPDDVYVAAGITLEIYNEEICQGINTEDYQFYWNCDVGDCMNDKFHYGGIDNDIGDYKLSVKVCDYQMNELASASTTLHVVANQFLKKDTQKIEMLTIGDSLTSAGTWKEYTRTMSVNKLSHIGTQGESEGLEHEGRAGFAAYNYLDGSAYEFDDGTVFTNPDGESFDWNYYKETTERDPDVVQVFLGTNGMSLEAENNAKSIVEIVKKIRKDDPEIPILVVQTIYPSDQDGMARQQNVLGFEGFHGMWSLERCHMTFNLMCELDKELKGMDNVYIVPAAITFDREHNFETTTMKVNPHSEETETVPSESIHPSEGGYEQIGDSMFSTLCYLISQDKIGKDPEK